MAGFRDLLWRVAPERYRMAVVEALGLPEGGLGRRVGRMLARANDGHNRRALEALAIRDGEHVLEFGHGPGTALAAILRIGPTVRAHGVDPAREMVAMTRRRNAHAVHEGRLEVRCGTTDRLPWPDASMDVAFGCNVLYFWHDPAVDLAELRRVLRPDGRIGLGFRPRSSADPEMASRFDRAGHQLYEAVQVEAMLLAAGFAGPTLHVDDDGWCFMVARRGQKVGVDVGDELTDEEVEGHWLVVD